MIAMWILCANTGYGQPFIESFAKFIKDNRQNGIVVLSGKNLRKAKWHKTRDMLKITKAHFSALRLAFTYGIKVKIVKDVNDARFSKSIPEGAVLISSGFNQIFKKDFIKKFSKAINAHPSLLPYYKGPTPCDWVIYHREKKTGISFHHIVPEIDSGDIVHQIVVPIHVTDEAKMLEARISQEAQEYFRQGLLPCLLKGSELVLTLVDASKIYSNSIDYLSFMKKENDGKKV